MSDEQHAKVIQNNQASNVTNVFQAEKRPGVPRCPLPNMTRLFGRGAVIDDLVQRLTGGEGTLALYAVRGLPGVGKTDLVRAVGCDRRITDHFVGGVLYAELGPAPDAATILVGWLRELEQEPPQTSDPLTLAAVVRGKLADRPTLIIVDDAWDTSFDIARTLRECATPYCAVLASSRSPDLAFELAGQTNALKLDVLEDDPAIALFRDLAPAVVNADPKGAKALVKGLGHLPLALRLAGKLLRDDRRNDHPCAALLQTWQQRLDDLRGRERRPGITDEQLSLDAIIGMSYDALSDDSTREAAAALSVFGATPLDWDWDAMVAVWETDEGIVEKWEKALVDSGLLEWNDETRRYTLHQTVHAFLSARCANTAFAERHASFYAVLMKQCDNRIDHENTIDDALAILDREIGQIERGQTITVERKLDQLTIDYAFACTRYYELRGRYDQQIRWQQAGWVAAERLKQEGSVAGLLGNLGNAHTHQSHYVDALAYIQLSLDIKRRIGSNSGIATDYSRIGIVYRLQGNFDMALEYLEQSLKMTKRLGDLTNTAVNLSNLGIVYQEQGRYDDALTHFQQGLRIMHRIRDVKAIAETNWNLGLVYEQQGNLIAALPLMEECVKWEEGIGHPDAVADRARVEELRTHIASGEA